VLAYFLHDWCFPAKIQQIILKMAVLSMNKGALNSRLGKNFVLLLKENKNSPTQD